MQLKLHILPGKAEETSGDLRNGIALSATYHRAFDNGPIYLDEDYVMRPNPDKEIQLVTRKLDDGLPAFKRALQKRILLPPDRRQRRDTAMIRKANKYRCIPA